MRLPFCPDSSRKVGVDCRPLRLADGQEWGFALPSTRYRPACVADEEGRGGRIEVVGVSSRVGYPLAIERRIDSLRNAREGGSPLVQYRALRELAVALLRRVHDLTELEAGGLVDLDLSRSVGLVDLILELMEMSRGPADGPRPGQPSASQAEQACQPNPTSPPTSPTTIPS